MKKQLHIIVKYFYPVAAGIETNILETFSPLTDKWDITIHTSTDTLTQKNVLAGNDSFRGFTIKRYPFRWYGYLPKFDIRKADIVALHNFNVVPHLCILLQTIFLKLTGQK